MNASHDSSRLMNSAVSGGHDDDSWPGGSTSGLPKVCANMSARAVAASCSIVRSPSPSSSSDPGRVAAAPAATSRTFCACSASSALASAQDRRQLVDDQAVGAIERDVRQVALLRQPAAVVARDVRDDRRLVVGEAEDLRRREDVLRMLVVRAQADVDADVVQQRRDLQQQPLAVAEPVLLAQLVEQPRREHARRGGRARDRSGTAGRASRRSPAPGARSPRRSAGSSARRGRAARRRAATRPRRRRVGPRSRTSSAR